MNEIWLDVTSILNWHRPAVGVIRTEAECARFALRHSQTLKIQFCRFDWEAGYRVVASREVQEAIERIDRSRDARGNAALPGQPYPVAGNGTTWTKLSTHARSILRRLPARVQQPLFHYLSIRREAAHAVLNAAREFRRAIRLWRNPLNRVSSVASSSTPKVRAVPFSRGDVYVSLGLDWDQKNQTYIAESKNRHGFKTLTWCYDVIPAKYPHLCVGDVSAKFAKYFADMAWHANEILCISECSRKDLLALLDQLGAPTPETSVIRLGSDLAKADGEEATAHTKEAAGERFILFVSTIERRKNHETLYRAYTQLIERGEKKLPRLVFVGMPGWGVGDFLADLNFDPRIHGLVKVLTNVSDTDLMWLYEHALFTVFPSLYEGWGLAVAESLANGKFCLASNAGSLPEVGGDLIEYIDPWDVPQWAERLKWYLDHPEELRKREGRIEAEYAAPTWENTARTVFARATALRDQEVRKVA